MTPTRGSTTSIPLPPLAFHLGSQTWLTYWPVYIAGLTFGVDSISLPIPVARIGWVVTGQEEINPSYLGQGSVFCLSSQIPKRKRFWVYEKQVLGRQGSWLSLLPVQCSSSDSEASLLITSTGKMKSSVWSEGTHFSLLSAHVNI